MLYTSMTHNLLCIVVALHNVYVYIYIINGYCTHRRAEEEYSMLVHQEQQQITSRGYQPKVRVITMYL